MFLLETQVFSAFLLSKSPRACKFLEGNQTTIRPYQYTKCNKNPREKVELHENGFLCSMFSQRRVLLQSLQGTHKFTDWHSDGLWHDSRLLSLDWLFCPFYLSLLVVKNPCVFHQNWSAKAERHLLRLRRVRIIRLKSMINGLKCRLPFKSEIFRFGLDYLSYSDGVHTLIIWPITFQNQKLSGIFYNFRKCS